MRSSTSSSETLVPPTPATPIARLGRGALLGAVLVFLAGMAVWETSWRGYGAVPGYRNTDGQWARQRRRIDSGEGNKTVLIGSSRILFGAQLDVWQKLTGERPIQLALEGTTPIPVLEDLADDPDFTGKLVVGVAPDLYFSGYANRRTAFGFHLRETPSQRFGEAVSMKLLEPWLASYDPDFALMKVLARLTWPAREGHRAMPVVRKLHVVGEDRNTRMWAKVENDEAYREMAKRTWASLFDGPPPAPPEVMIAGMKEQIARSKAAVAKLRARGVPVVFVRFPSTGRYYEAELRNVPRVPTWDVLLAETGAPGVHFEDHPELQGYTLPEWSHLSAVEADRYTAALVPLVEKAFAGQKR